MSEPRIFEAEGGKNVIEVICAQPGSSFSCCGKELREVKANTTEGAAEKHIPLVEQNGSSVTVSVGSVLHPMTEEHSIDFVFLETEKGIQRVNLTPNQPPKASFAVADGDRAVAAYAYCNLHGFWKASI